MNFAFYHDKNEKYPNWSVSVLAVMTRVQTGQLCRDVHTTYPGTNEERSDGTIPLRKRLERSTTGSNEEYSTGFVLI